MAREIIDISMPLENDVISDPPAFLPKITYIDHQMSVDQVRGFFPGLAKADLPDGEGWAIERVELITHNGTHLDAPYHFASTMNQGERAITIDEVPLDWCFQPGVKLDYAVPDDVGEAHTDGGRLRQIVINLLSNAIKFTESGEVAVRVGKADSSEGDAALVISVSDTGAGIPTEALDSIFEEFQQVKGSDPQHKGTGLGLPITKGFAELLGGSIGVESEVGKGSTFTVRVPVVYEEN